jgi:hypothetical protein
MTGGYPSAAEAAQATGNAPTVPNPIGPPRLPASLGATPPQMALQPSAPVAQPPEPAVPSDASGMGAPGLLERIGSGARFSPILGLIDMLATTFRGGHSGFGDYENRLALNKSATALTAAHTTSRLEAEKAQAQADKANTTARLEDMRNKRGYHTTAMTELEKAIGGPATEEARNSYKKLYAQHAAAVDKIDKDTARLTGDEVVNSYPIDVSQATGLPPTEKQVGTKPADTSYMDEPTPYGDTTFLGMDKLKGMKPADRTAALNDANARGTRILTEQQAPIARTLNVAKDNLRTMLRYAYLLPDSPSGMSIQRPINWAEAATGIGTNAPLLKTLRQSMDATFANAKLLATSAGGGSSGMRASKELLELSNKINAMQAPDTRQAAREQAQTLNEFFNNVGRELFGAKSVPAQEQDPFVNEINALTPLRSDRPKANGPLKGQARKKPSLDELVRTQ